MMKEGCTYDEGTTPHMHSFVECPRSGMHAAVGA